VAVALPRVPHQPPEPRLRQAGARPNRVYVPSTRSGPPRCAIDAVRPGCRGRAVGQVPEPAAARDG